MLTPYKLVNCGGVDLSRVHGGRQSALVAGLSVCVCVCVCVLHNQLPHRVAVPPAKMPHS